MRIIKTGLIGVIFFSTLLLGMNVVLFNTNNTSTEKLFQNYNIDYSNTSLTLSVSSSRNAFLTATVFINGSSFTYHSSTSSLNQSISISFPGQTYLLSASLSQQLNSSAKEQFMVNKSIYQPDAFILSKYSSLNNFNQTMYIFKSNLEIIRDLSNVKLLNTTSGSFFYSYVYPVTKNTSVTLVDSYYRHFNEFLISLDNYSNSNDLGSNITIITINDTSLNQSTIPDILLNGTINNKQFVGNMTTSTKANLTNTTILSNDTIINDSTISLSKIVSNNSIGVLKSTIHNTTLNSLNLDIAGSIISNSTLSANNLTITDSIINNSIIHSNSVYYENVTFINQSTTIPSKKFNFSVNYSIESNNSILLQLTTNQQANVTVSLSAPIFSMTKNLTKVVGNSSVTFSNLPFANYTFSVNFDTFSNKSYSHSFFVDLKDKQSPTLVNYSLVTGYTNVSIVVQFSEYSSGFMELCNATSCLFSNTITNLSSLNKSYSHLNPYASYYIHIQIQDNASNVLDVNLPTFYLKSINSSSFIFTTDKTAINNTENNLTITPSLYLNGKLYSNSNTSLVITVSFIDNYTFSGIYAYGPVTIFFNPKMLQALPNSQFTISVTVLDFNITNTKTLTLYTPELLNYNVSVVIDQSTVNDTATISITTNINASELVFFGIVNQSQSLINLTSLTKSNTLSFANLQYKKYNLTILFSSWDNQLSTYYYYFTVNDTLTPKVGSYTLSTDYTNINLSISFSELVNVQILTYSHTNGSLVNTYLNFNYQTSWFLSMAGLSPYQDYKITVTANDPAGNQVIYNITNIQMKPIISKELKSTVDKSIILKNNYNVLFNTTTVINNASISGQLAITTNVSLTVYSASTGSFILQFDPILLDSLAQNTVINVTLTNKVFLASTSILLIYVLQDNGSVSPSLSLATNSSFIGNNVPLKVHISSSFSSSMVFGSKTIIGVLLQNSSTSLGYYSVSSSGSSLTADIILLPTFDLNSGFITIIVRLYGNNAFKSINKSISLQIASASFIAPTLENRSVSLVQTSTMLSLLANEPVIVIISYSVTKGSFTNYTYPLNYVNGVYLNISDFMTLNSNNYYTITLMDSKGTNILYNNNSNYYEVFVQKLDVIPPSITGNITVTSDYHIQFTATEPVTVTVTCQDYFSTVSTCYSSTTYNTSIYGLLTLALPGIYYTVTQVQITDKAGNLYVTNPNIVFYYA